MPASSPSIERLAEEGLDLLLFCPDCGASVIAPARKVLLRFGPNATISDVEAPVVCKHCGSIDVSIRPIETTAA